MWSSRPLPLVVTTCSTTWMYLMVGDVVEGADTIQTGHGDSRARSNLGWSRGRGGVVAGSSAAIVWVDTKPSCMLSMSRLAQMVDVCLHGLRMSNCCMVEGGGAPTGPKLTVATIPATEMSPQIQRYRCWGRDPVSNTRQAPHHLTCWWCCRSRSPAPGRHLIPLAAYTRTGPQPRRRWGYDPTSNT